MKYATDADLRSLRRNERPPDARERPESPPKTPEAGPGRAQIRPKQHRNMRSYKIGPMTRMYAACRQKIGAKSYNNKRGVYVHSSF